MSMALKRVKTEMKGTGGGRWTTRADAKRSSRKARREADRDGERDHADRVAELRERGRLG